MNIINFFKKLNPTLEYIPSFTIKSIKNFRGHDGEPLLQANLFIDGKNVAFIGNDSWGGPFDIRPNGNMTNSELRKKLKELIDTKKFFEPCTFSDGGLRPVAYNDYISTLLDVFDLLASARRVKKTKTLIYNPKTCVLGTVNAPLVRLSPKWIKNNLKSDDVIISEFV